MKIFILPLILCCSLVSYTQTPIITFEEIWDNRSSKSANTMSIRFKVSGIQLDGDHLLKIDTLYPLEDDLGGKMEIRYNEDNTSLNNYKEDVRSRYKLRTLVTSNRRAQYIKSFKGTFKYFTPSTETGSKLRFPFVKELLNKNMLRDFDSEVVLIPLDNKYFGNLYKMNKEQYEREVRAMLRRESRNTDLSVIFHVFPDPAKNIPDSRIFFIPSETTHSFFLFDPNNRIVEVKIYDAGNRQVDKTYNRVDSSIAKEIQGAPGPGWTFEVLLETPNSVRKIDFELKDIELP